MGAAKYTSDAGIVLGDGTPKGRPGDYFVWTSALDGVPVPCDFLGQPGEINDLGEVAATARTNDGSLRAIMWRKGAIADLGVYKGRDSGAVAINNHGLIAGWVCIDAVDRGQKNYRPAAWMSQKMKVLQEFGCDWGQAVGVNDTGLVLVVGYVGWQCRSILWNPAESHGCDVHQGRLSACRITTTTVVDRFESPIPALPWGSRPPITALTLWFGHADITSAILNAARGKC